MNRDEVRSQLVGMIREFFGDASLSVNDQTTAADIPGWDSLAHVEFILVVEKGFAVRFRAAEIQGLKNVGQLVDLIVRRRPG